MSQQHACCRVKPELTPVHQLQLESSMCLLRGQIHLRLSSTQQAKECFLEALSLDVRCYDAFAALVGGEMMGVEEGERALRASLLLAS